MNARLYLENGIKAFFTRRMAEVLPTSAPLYPLRFEPIFKSMLWGGDRLPKLFRYHAATGGPLGEAWVLSDVDGSLSRVANGPLAGKTLRELLAENSRGILGNAPAPNGRFPLLLKFIDARKELSVQVHPTDEIAHAKKPGTAGKTEAWVILDADPTTSRIYAGFQSGMCADKFRLALAENTTLHTLHSFIPKPGDCVFLPAGTVHAIGANVLLFEVQQTSDTTYRLYDWDRVDAKTGKPRDLHIDDGLESSDFAAGPCRPVEPEPEAADGREKLVRCRYFTLDRVMTARRTQLGAKGECRMVVVTAGHGRLGGEPVARGDTVLLPAAVGACALEPAGPMTVLECGVPA